MKKQISILNNQKGSMLVNALAVSIIVAVVSGVILQQSLTSLKTLRLPRIKSAMSAVEGSIRHIAMQPGSYSNCDTPAGAGFSSCSFDLTQLASLKETIPGCDGAPGCGIFVASVAGPDAGFDGTTKTLFTTISYEGAEISVKSKVVTIVVPDEILQQNTILCPDATPIFQGFNPSGTKKCRALDTGKPNGCNTAGTYMAGFNVDTMNYVCQTISSAGVSCGGMIQNVSFVGSAFNYTCTGRTAPTTIWPTAVAPP